jgi:CheY-like chemotaxis protein
VKTGNVNILLVQDDVADAVLMSDELEAHKVANRVELVRDTATALAYLEGTASYTRPGRPDLVLLDLNLPGRGGRVVLRRLRAGPETASVPVILLVDSPAAKQIVSAEFLPVQGYAYKPVVFERLVAIVQSLDDLGFQFRRRQP